MDDIQVNLFLGFDNQFEFSSIVWQFFIIMLHVLSNYLIIVVTCEWNAWDSTSYCSVTCGEGTQTQRRTKSVEEAAGGTCSGINRKTISCTKDECTTLGTPLL